MDIRYGLSLLVVVALSALWGFGVHLMPDIPSYIAGSVIITALICYWIVCAMFDGFWDSVSQMGEITFTVLCFIIATALGMIF